MKQDQKVFEAPSEGATIKSLFDSVPIS